MSETPGVQRKKLIATMHHLLFDTNPDIVILCNNKIKVSAGHLSANHKENSFAISLHWLFIQLCPREGGLNLNSLAEDMSAISRQKRLLIGYKEWIPWQHLEQEEQDFLLAHLGA